VYLAPLPVTGAPVTIEAKGDVKAVRLSRTAVTGLRGEAIPRQSRGRSPDVYEQKVADALAAGTAGRRGRRAAGTDWMATMPPFPPASPRSLSGCRAPSPRDDRAAGRPRGHDEGRAGDREGGRRGARVAHPAHLPHPARPAAHRPHRSLPGKTIIPGLVDVHAHMGYSTLDILPRTVGVPREPRLRRHHTLDPSASTQSVFALGELVESGRIMGRASTRPGSCSTAPSIQQGGHTSLDDARAHVRRLKALGAFSVKSYNSCGATAAVDHPGRPGRGNAGVPRGRLDAPAEPLDDPRRPHGHRACHSVAPLYKDVVTLLARSRTGYTPTLIVGYGGVWARTTGTRCPTCSPTNGSAGRAGDQLDARARRRMLVPEEEFYHIELARRPGHREAGGSVQLARTPAAGTGAHWELWMLAQAA